LKALGKHLLLELNDCDRVLLNDIHALRDILLDAANQCGATVLSDSFHQFNPCGVSGAVIIAESHITIHTWPEHGYAAADIFTCGTTVQPEKAADVIIERIGAKTHAIIQVMRGIVDTKQRVAG
jgi:S-adenosylmethionine decarboxylase proenzyme